MREKKERKKKIRKPVTNIKIQLIKLKKKLN